MRKGDMTIDRRSRNFQGPGIMGLLAVFACTMILALPRSSAQDADRVVRVQDIEVDAGGNGTLVIEMSNAQGNEAGAGLSLQFDPNLISIPEDAANPVDDDTIELGPNVPSAAADQVNRNKLNEGKLGLGFAIFGETLPAGDLTLFTVDFTVVQDAAASFMELALIDDPVVREVSDDEANSVNATFEGGLVTIFGGNFAPTMDPGGAIPGTVNVNEDEAVADINFSIDDPEAFDDRVSSHPTSASLEVTAESDNGTLIPKSNISISGSGQNRTLSLQLARDQAGTATITVTVTDGGPIERSTSGQAASRKSDSKQFDVNVQEQNDAPTISNIANRELPLVNVTTVDFQVNDVEDDPGNLQVDAQVTVSSDPNPIVSLNTGGSGTTRQLSIETGQAEGEASIEVTVTDSDGASNSDTIHVTVRNQPPVAQADEYGLTEGATLAVTEPANGVLANDSDPEGNAFTAVLIEGPSQAQSFTLNADGTFNYQHDGSDQVTDTFTYQADDGDEASAPATVVLNIDPVNDAPTLADIADPNPIDEDAGQQTVNLSGIGAGGSESQQLQVTATSDNSDLISQVAVNYASPESMGSLNYTPEANQHGSATITVTVTDAGLDGALGSDDDGTVSRSFTVQVQPVNDPPTLNAIPAPDPITEDAGEQAIELSGISAGPNEDQQLQVAASSDNPTLIADPAVDYSSPEATGTLRYQPESDELGEATLTVTVTDAGLDGELGTDDDAQVSRSFNVVVERGGPTAKDDFFDVTVTEEEKEFELDVLDNDEFEGSATVSQILAVSAQGTAEVDAAGTKVIYTPREGFFGQDAFTYEIREDGRTDVAEFTVRVFKGNDAPTIEHQRTEVVDSFFDVFFQIDDSETPVNELGFRVNITGALSQGSAQTTSQGGGVWKVNLPAPTEPAVGAVEATVTDAQGGTATLSVPLGRAEGVAVDGYLQGSTVLVDANGDGQAQDSEVIGTTGPQGQFSALVDGERADGTLVVQGGTDVATGLPLENRLRAPNGSTMITALSSVVAELVSDGQSLSDAENMVKGAFGVPGEVDLLNQDPIAGTLAGDSSSQQFLGALVQAQNILVETSAAIQGNTGSDDRLAIGDEVVKALANEVKANVTGNIDFTSQATLQSIISGAAESAGAGLSDPLVEGAAQVLSEANAQVKAATSGDGGAETLVKVAQIQKVSYSSVANDLAGAGSGEQDIGEVTERHTGDNFSGQVQTASVGDVSGTGETPGSLALGQAAYDVNEGDGQVVLTVVRSGGTLGEVTGQVSLEGDTATAGDDFEAGPYSVSFSEGETGSKEIAIGVTDDAEGEGNEAFMVTLGNVSGGAAIGDPSQSTVTIVDNDEVAPVELAGISVADGSVTFEISGAANQTIAVEVSSDLESWEEVGTVTLDAGGAGAFIDSSAGDATVRFYRAVLAQ